MKYTNLTIACLGLAGIFFQNSSLKASSCPDSSEIRQALADKYGTGNLSMDVNGKKYLRSLSPHDVVIERLNDSHCLYKMVSEGTITAAPSSSASTKANACASTSDLKKIFAETVGNGKASIDIKGKTYIRFFEESNVTMEQTKKDSACTYDIVVNGFLFG